MKTSDYPHGQYKKGDKIRAYDFIGDTEHYLEGEILDIGHFTHASSASYKVKVEVDTLYAKSQYESRGTAFVPLGLAWGEWDSRIEKIN